MDPIKQSENQFLSSAKDTIVPREMVFGYVEDLKISPKKLFITVSCTGLPGSKMQILDHRGTEEH